jgi:hypothetical protein
VQQSELPPDLESVVDVWSELPAALREEIVDLVSWAVGEFRRMGK